MARVRKAVITAAGWGTRFLPATKSQPKEMLPLLNRPLIQYSVEEAAACGVDLVVIVTSLGKKPMEDYFDRSFELEQMLERQGKSQQAEEIRRLSGLADICYVRQKEQLGLGHAVLTAKNVVGDEPFILFLPDDIFEQGKLVLKQMLDIHEHRKGSVISVREVAEAEVGRYGIIKPRKVADRVYEVLDLIEKPKIGEAPSRLAIMGRYVLTPGVFSAIENTPPGRNGEIQITDALKRLNQKQPMHAYEFEGELYDAGTLLGWLKTTVALGLKDPSVGPELKSFLRDRLRD
ncbi:MAG: UTP--glucose-1-phosphate uridylyltransferase GalU [Chloroflexi bacterium]|nr:UTP--glucose-1-phosphate uridylyltransferase GalU [Chloroflexota bacterium]